MKLNAEEREAVAVFKSDPARQEELRSFMAEQGSDFGRRISDVTCTLPPKVLLSNSGRCAAADIAAKALKDQRKTLRSIGHDDRGIEIFVASAKTELAWLGV
jgi:hypothetical protein